MLDFRILGPLEVDRGGAPVELSGLRARATLVLLLLEANRVVPAERLVDALWGERPPPTAAAALRNTVSHLRRELGREVIETRPPGYRLCLPEGSFDVARFEHRLADAWRLPAEERAPALREALAEWRGSPLPELTYLAAVNDEIRRLEELRVAAEEELLESELAGGNPLDLIPRIESLIARHPHRERLRGQLMRALYRAGRQAEALSAYQAARRALSDDLGLDPGPELRRLHGAILRQEAGLDEPSARAAASNVDHVREVVDALLSGRLVPVLASAADVSADLAGRFGYPSDHVVETPRVSQYVATLRGPGPLHDELRALAEARGDPTPLHRFLASLPPLLRERGLPHQLLVTTDYDDALERAFTEADEQVDVVTYLGAGPARGKFCHAAPDGTMCVIDDPGQYAAELSLERRTVVLRLRGRIDARPGRDWESFVVTEDDHLDYLRTSDVAGGIPVSLAATLRRSHFLFVGYAVRDWCLRVVLSRICADGPLAYRSWAIAKDPGPTEEELWRRAGVELVRADLERYTSALEAGVASGTTVAP
ncbi:MAG: BTAD domain-containing putative transcriptional regulator [Gaiellaceae bacterium]